MKTKTKLYLVVLMILGIIVSVIFMRGRLLEDSKRNVYAVLPLTGSMSELGKTAKSSMELYLNLVKDTRINVVYVDSESIPSKAISAVAQKTVGESQPIVVTAFSFLANPVIGAVAERNGFTFAIATASVNSNLVHGTHSYQKVSTGVADVVTPIVRFANKRYKTAAIIFSSDEYGERNKSFFRQHFSGKVIAETPFHLSDPNVRELVASALRASPDMIFVTGSATIPYVNMFTEMKSMGYKGQIMADLAFANTFAYTSLGEQANGIVFSCTKSDFSQADDVNSDFRSGCLNYGVRPYFLTSQAYDVLALIDYAIKNGFEFKQDEFLNMGTFSEGVETIKFTGSGECWYDCKLATIVNGKVTPVEKSNE